MSIHDAPTPNPDAAPSVERIWQRMLRLEKEQKLLRNDFEKQLNSLRSDFNATTESIKDDFVGFSERIGLLEEDIFEVKGIMSAAKVTNDANNLLLQGIDRKLSKLVPD